MFKRLVFLILAICFAAGLSFTAPTTAHARFLQTDPIGYEDNVNLYSYVGNDPANNIDPTGEDTMVRLKARPLEGKAGYAGYGHAFLEYEDTETGEIRITRGGPSEEYTGGFVEAFNDEPVEGVNIKAFDTPASESIDKSTGGVKTLDEVNLEKDFGEVKEQLNNFVDDVNDAKIPYRPRSTNSNAFAGDAYELVTGKEPENNSFLVLEGLDVDLDVKEREK